MITVHHLENSQSVRVLWLLEELGVDYEVKQYARDKQTSLAPRALKALHPMGTSPTITDGDAVLAESNAIVDYILDKHGDGRLRPAPGTPERARYLFWFHAAQGSFMPLLIIKLMFNRFVSGAPFFVRPIMKSAVGRVEAMFLRPRIEKMLDHIEAELGRSTWFAGEALTAADIVMGYCMEVAAVRAGMDARYPKSLQFLERMRARPAYKAAMQKGGPFVPLTG